MDNYDSVGLAALDFSNYVAVNRTLVHKFGLHVAVLIGELASEARYYLKRGQLEGGWFFSTVENIKDATGLSEHFQREAFNVAKNNGLVEVRYKGLPRKRYVRVNARAVLAAMDGQRSAVQAQCFTTSSTNDAQHEAPMVDQNNNNNYKKQQQEQPKKERKKSAETYDSIIDGFTQDEQLREALRDFLQYKVASCHRAKKEFTNRALKVNLTKLSKLSSDPREMVEIVNQTLERSWSGFFPLKSDYSQKRQPEQQKLEISEPRIGSMRIDNMTGRQEVYKGNGVWEEYVSDYVPQEGDEDIDL